MNMNMNMNIYKQVFIMNNKLIFEKVIDTVRELHKRTTTEKKTKLTNEILTSMYCSYKNTVNDSFEREYVFEVVREMCIYVRQKCNVSTHDILSAWIKFVSKDFTLTTTEQMVIDYLVDFFFGDYQQYELMFEHKDIETGKGRYYYVCKFDFNKTTTRMYLSVQDGKNANNTLCSSHEKGLSFITGSELSDNGFLVFDVNDNTLHGLSKYLYYHYGNYGFMNDFELYPICSMKRLMKSVIIKSIPYKFKHLVRVQDFIDDFIVQRGYNKKLFDIMCSSLS